MKEAVCILLQDSEGRILGVSRKYDQCLFGLPGGKVDVGESLQDAAIRECKEETGLDVWSLKEAFSAVCGKYKSTTFFAQFDSTQEFITSEKGMVKWITWDKLVSGPFGAYAKDLLLNRTNSTVYENFLEIFKRKLKEDCTKERLHLLYQMVEELSLCENFEQIDFLIRDLPIIDLDKNLVLSILSMLQESAPHLKNYLALYEDAQRRLLILDPERAESLLSGFGLASCFI